MTLIQTSSDATQHTAPMSGALLLAATARKTNPRAFPNLPLVTHTGAEVKFYADVLKGKVLMISFMYTNCDGKCPGIIANLVRVQKALGDRVGRDVFMYSISLDPERDTPDALKEYADNFGAGPGWTFLTGSREAIEVVRRKLGYRDRDPRLDKDKSQHSGLVLVGNEPMDRWSACPGQVMPARIIQSVDWVTGSKRGGAVGKVIGGEPPRPYRTTHGPGRSSVPTILNVKQESL